MYRARHIALALIFAITLTACGADDAPTSTPVEPTATASSTQTASEAIPTATPESQATTQEISQPQPTPTQVIRQPGYLLFISSGLRNPGDGHQQLRLVGSDGSDLRALTDHPGNHLMPAWSPNGQQIVFVSDREGFQELYVIDADGTNLRRITNNDWQEQWPTWSPDGSQIAFECYPERESGGQRDSQICAINPDGSNLRNLSENSVHGYDPAWSPDGSQLAFTGMTDAGFDQIYVINADGTDPRQLTNNPNGSNMDPDWSPDGSKLAFSGSSESGPAILIINADGSDIRTVATGVADGSAIMPAWSPDGEQIAYVNAAGTHNAPVMVVDADGSNPHQIADQSGYSAHPAWSPDATQLAFVTTSEDHSALNIIDATGANLRTLAENVGALTKATWRPLDHPLPAPQPTPTPPPAADDLPTLKEIYAKAAASMTLPGMLFHMTQTISSDAGMYSYEGSMEWWVDAERNLVRREMTRTMGPFDVDGETQSIQFEGVTIIIDGASRTLTTSPESNLRTSPAQSCYQVSEAVSAVLGCPGATEDSTTTVEHAEYLGQPVIALVKIGTSRGEDEYSTFTDRLYLYPETALPIAREINGSFSAGETTPLATLIEYQHEFIPIENAPPDAFDPLSLVKARLASLQTDIPIYWLGLHFEPESDLPPLTITDGGPPDHPDPQLEAILSYHLAGDQPTQFAPHIILQQWSRQAWEAGPATGVPDAWSTQPCHETTELALPDGHATIFLSHNSSTNTMPTSLGYNLPTPPTDGPCLDNTTTRIEAIIEFQDTVVFLYIYDIQTPPNIDNAESTPNPYLAQQGIETLIQGLHPMENPTP